MAKKENEAAIKAWKEKIKRDALGNPIDPGLVKNVGKINAKQTEKPSETTEIILGLIVIAVAGFIAFKLIVGGFNYVSNIDFSLPKISFFGESEKDKKIKETNKRIEQLEKEVSSLKLQQQSTDNAERIQELEDQISACAMGIEPACIP